MSAFRHTHKDGRTGEGWSAWAAIVTAVGPVEGNAFIDQLREAIYRPENGEDYHAEASVELESGEIMGELFKLTSQEDNEDKAI